MSDFFTSPQDGLHEINLGPVRIEEGALSDGTPEPLSVRTCTGFEQLAVYVPWTEASASQKATISFSDNTCEPGYPKQVTVSLTHYSKAELTAYDTAGNAVGPQQAGTQGVIHQLVFFDADGITKIEIEGAEICIFKVCWKCEFEKEPRTWVALDPQSEPGDPVTMTVDESNPDRLLLRLQIPGFYASVRQYAGRDFAVIEFPEIGVLDGLGLESGEEWFQFPQGDLPPLPYDRYKRALYAQIGKPPFPENLVGEIEEPAWDRDRTGELILDSVGARPGVPALRGLLAADPEAAGENVYQMTDTIVQPSKATQGIEGLSQSQQIVKVPASDSSPQSEHEFVVDRDGNRVTVKLPVPLIPAGYSGLDQQPPEGTNPFNPPEFYDAQFYEEFEGEYTGGIEPFSENTRMGPFTGMEFSHPILTVLNANEVRMGMSVELEITGCGNGLPPEIEEKGKPLGWDDWVNKPPFLNGHMIPGELEEYGVGVVGRRTARYLILTPGEYTDELQQMVQWKQSKGLAVDVRTVGSDPGDAVTADRDEIDKYIEDYHTSYQPATIFVLLVGDEDVIPSGRSDKLSVSPDGDQSDSDQVYEVIGSGRFATVYVGRLSVDSGEDLTNQLDRIIRYDRGLSLGTWPQEVTLCANSETSGSCLGVCTNFPSKYAQAVEDIDGYNQYNIQPNFEVLHAGAANQSAQRATNQDVIDAVNDGRGHLLYRGHGSTTAWVYGWDGTSSTGDNFDAGGELQQLSNSIHPIVYSIACQNNRIKAEDSIGEDWMSFEDAGSVAHWAATVNSYTVENHNRAKGVFRAIYEKGVSRLGPVLAEAEQISWGMTGSNSVWDSNTFCYLLLGDPEMSVRRTGVNIPEKIQSELSQVGEDLQVLLEDDEGEPLKGALVNLELKDGSTKNTHTGTDGTAGFAGILSDQVVRVHIHSDQYSTKVVELGEPQPTPTPTMTPTQRPTAVPGWLVLSQGYGGTTSNKLVRTSDLKRVASFAGLPPNFAEAIGSSRARSIDSAVTDVDGDDVPDVLLGFGAGGKGSKFPSIILGWTPARELGNRSNVLSSRNVFAPEAGNALLRNIHGAINVTAGVFVAKRHDQTSPLIIGAAQGQGGDNIIRLLTYQPAEKGLGKLEFVGLIQGLTGAAVQGNSSGGTSVAAGDVDGDGLDELVVAQMNGEKATTLFQVLDLGTSNGNVVVTSRTSPMPAMPEGYRGLGGVNLAVGDVNNDGRDEIIVASAGMPDGAKGDPNLKNLIRVFSARTDKSNQIASIEPLTDPILVLGPDRNPSGGLHIDAGNLDNEPGDELAIGTQAISVLNEDGEVRAEHPAPAAIVRGFKLLFDEKGRFAGQKTVVPPFKAFAGDFLPGSGSVAVSIFPRGPIVPPPITPLPTPTDTPTNTPTNTPTVTPTATPTGEPTQYVPPKLGWVPFTDDPQTGKAPISAMKDETSTGTMVDVRVPGMYAHEHKQDGVIYHRLSIPGHATRMNVGEPELPMIGRMIEVPYGVDFSVDIVKTESVTLQNYNVFPKQMPNIRELNFPDPVNVKFVKNQNRYAMDENYPGPLAGFGPRDVGVIRGHRVLMLKVYPLQYNPVQKTLTAYSRIEVRVKFSQPAQIVGVDERIQSPVFEQVMKKSVLNYKEPVRFPTRAPSPGQFGADYLIITSAELYNEKDDTNPIVKLRKWKQQKGLVTRVATLDTIGSATTDIQSFIQTAYDSWNIPPTYVVLVGDSELMPTTYINDHPTSHSNTAVASDLYYVTVDGSDYFPDIFLGRLSVDGMNQLNTVVDKIIQYEKDPPQDADYYENTSLVCLFEDGNSDGRENATFRIIENADAIRQFITGQGYNCAQIYDESGSFANGPQRYENNTQLPSRLTQPSFPWNGGTADITNALENTGNFLMTYNGHGGRLSWGRPGYNTNNVGNLSNGDLTPVLFSMACMTGWFDNETDLNSLNTNNGTESLCEAFIRQASGGAVAAFGATRVSWAPNDFIKLGLYKGPWPGFSPSPPLRNRTIPTINNSAVYRMGPVTVFGLVYMANSFNDTNTRRATFEMYTLFGDPDMSMWTEEPGILQVQHPDGIGATGEQDFVIAVTDDDTGDPVHSARVVLTRSNTILGTQLTNPGGIARFTLDNVGSGNITVTVTAHNYRPYEGMMEAVSGGAELNRLDPDNGVENARVLVGGVKFQSGEDVDIFFDGQLMKTVTASGGSFGQAGVNDVEIQVPSPSPLGPVNIVAQGKTSGRYAVDVFQVRSENPVDLYTYSQWAQSTWHLSSGGNPTWNNPEIQLTDAGGNPVQSNNLSVGTNYTINATIHNDSNFRAEGVKVTFRWANFGVGQSDRLWTDIGTDTIDVPANGTTDAQVQWSPTGTGHICIKVSIFHVEDANTDDNEGQENTHVGPTSSPAEIEFLIFNETEEEDWVHIEIRQLGLPDIIKEKLPYWLTSVEHPDPQLIQAGADQRAKAIVEPGNINITDGQQAEFALTAFIRGEMVGGVNFTVTYQD